MSIDKIDSNAIGSYTKEAYPKLFEQVGINGLQKIQDHDELAAKLVAELNDCDQVIYVGFSNLKSDYPEKIASFVDCKNGKRFIVLNGIIQK